MPWINPIKDTLLKLRPVDSKQLNPNEFRARSANDKLAVVAVRKAENNHWQVRLSGDLTIGGIKTRECYLWPGHWDGVGAALLGSEDAARVKAISMSAPIRKSVDGGVILDIGYESQTDNKNNPSGSCNVTSCVMALKYWGIKPPGPGQFEDSLYEWLQAEGLSRHDPNHLKIAIEHFGCEDHFTTRATVAEMKTALGNGTPVIVHGYFTTFGHIIVLIGYNEKGFICHDPWGEWTSSGYDRNDSKNPHKGKAIVYSYGLIERTCLPDGGCWAHFVTRKGYEKPGAQALIEPGTKPPIIATVEGGFRKFKPQELRLNSHSVKVIEHFEGLELHQYFCSAKVRTIGLGSTRWWNGEPIPLGATITKEQAINLFTRDASEFIAAIQKLVDVPLTARQLAAVFSLCYNIGWQGFERSSVLKSINNGAGHDEIRANLRKWSKAGGQPLPGLLRRRNAEAMLWENRDDWAKAGFD